MADLTWDDGEESDLPDGGGRQRKDQEGRLLRVILQNKRRKNWWAFLVIEQYT